MSSVARCGLVAVGCFVLVLPGVQRAWWSIGRGWRSGGSVDNSLGGEVLGREGGRLGNSFYESLPTQRKRISEREKREKEESERTLTRKGLYESSRILLIILA